MNEILWGFQRTNDNYQDLQLQEYILKYFDDININMKTFSSEEINYDSIDGILEQIKNIAITISLDSEQNDVLEYMLAVTLIKTSVTEEDFFVKLDKIERHFNSLKWRFHELVKIMLHSEDKQKYKEYLDKLQDLAEKEMSGYISTGVPFYSSAVLDTQKYYQQNRKKLLKKQDITCLWGDTELNLFDLEFEGTRTAFYILYLLNESKYIKLMQRFSDPYSCRMALNAINSELDDSGQWVKMVENVDNAFAKEGDWDTSKLVLPLLMEIADDKLKAFERSFHLNTYSSQADVDDAIAKINPIIEFIISNLISKSFKGTLRWMLYKIKNSRSFEIIQEVKITQGKLPDINGYIFSKYIDVFCDKSGLNSQDIEITWNDLLDYEGLFCNLLQIYPEYNAQKEGGFSKDFFKDWSFDAKTWYGKNGNEFRKALKYLYVSDDQIGFIEDKYRLLAFLLFKNIQNKNSLEDWYKLLLSSDLFLDILKYTKNEKAKLGFDNGMSSRDSLHLIARIGLDLLLILINQKEGKAAIVHDTLFSFYFKCLERDFLPDFYFECIKLLALLRVYVQIDTDENSMYKILHSSRFELKNYLNALQPYNMIYAKFVHFLNKNGLDKKYFIEETHIKAQMQSQVDILETMLNLQDRHYEISPQILDVMRDIVGSSLESSDILIN